MRGKVLGAVAAGGGLGALARYELAFHLAPVTPPAFPWVTLSINVAGAFLLGALMTLVLEVWPPTRYVRPFFGIGVLGGFTTWSTFQVESAKLLGAHEAGTALLYMGSSLALGMMAVAAGAALAFALSRPRGAAHSGGER